MEYDKSAVAEVLKQHLPDWRRTINELQRYSATGKIDSGILTNINEESFRQMVRYLKEKDFTSARKWVGENTDSDANVIYRKLYDNCADYITKNSVPTLVLILAKYQYQAAFCADQEINLMACLVDMMVELEYV